MIAPVTPVRPTDRVSTVLARDEKLVEVFVRHSSHFQKLRDGAMRRVMARLVTVQQAAVLAGVPVETLVDELNAVLHVAAAPAGKASSAEETPATPVRVHPSAAKVVELDVRDDLRAGREPLSRINSAANALRCDEVLHLRAIFQPVPLLGLLGRRGFAHEVQQHAADDWSIWFWRAPSEAMSAEPAARTAGAAAGNGAPDTIWLDVRGLQPPEPLMRTLAALDALSAGHQLVQVNERVPQLLFPMLAERGYACEVDESHADRVLVRIWRPA